MLAPLTARTATLNDSPHLDPGELAESRLRCNSYLALQRVSCDFHEGVLVLRGRVPTYYLKQMALAAVTGVTGIGRVVDHIDVGSAST